MKVRIVSPAEFDRHEREIRFVATVDNRQIRVAIDHYALFIASEALQIGPGDPLAIYAASGRLLEAVLAAAIEATGALQDSYFLSSRDVLRVTGRSGQGVSDVPARWTGA